MQTNIDIAMAFIETPDGVLSIHQISRKLKMPYGTAYNRLHALNKQGVVQMLQQGKAKLCALNSQNPMTACLLALGSAQLTDKFSKSSADVGRVLKSIVKIFTSDFKDKVSTAILLNPASLIEICRLSAAGGYLGETSKPELSLDLFYIVNSADFNASDAEKITNDRLLPILPIKAGVMAIDSSTLLGMFAENENEAGLSAYSMLHDGLVLVGFENFYSLILKAFAQRLVK